MTAKDVLGFPVAYGDYVMVSDVKLDEAHTLVGTIVRISKLSEGPKGIAAQGAYVDLDGTVSVARIPVDIAKSRLVMRSNGEALVGGGVAAYAEPTTSMIGATGGAHAQTGADAPEGGAQKSEAARKKPA